MRYARECGRYTLAFTSLSSTCPHTPAGASGSDNRKICDDGKAQALTEGDIRVMKGHGISGEVSKEALVLVATPWGPVTRGSYWAVGEVAWLHSETPVDSGISDKDHSYLYLGQVSRSHFPIVVNTFEPLKRGQPLYNGARHIRDSEVPIVVRVVLLGDPLTGV